MPNVVGSYKGTKLWVGGSRTRAPDVDFILNVQCRPIKGERHFPLRDSGSERPERLVAAVELLHSLMQRSSRGVYLHCAAGRNRSIVVAGLWLAWTQGHSLHRALSIVKRRHPRANPNPALVNVGKLAMRTLRWKGEVD
jgi:protein-tyrosine phosphatase